MWLKSTDGQWINSDHIVRIYLHAVRESTGFAAFEEGQLHGRKAIVDLANGHSMTLAYFSNNGDLEQKSAQFAGHLRHAFQQNEPFVDFLELGYEPLPPEITLANDHMFPTHDPV